MFFFLFYANLNKQKNPIAHNLYSKFSINSKGVSTSPSKFIYICYSIKKQLKMTLTMTFKVALITTNNNKSTTNTDKKEKQTSWRLCECKRLCVRAQVCFCKWFYAQLFFCTCKTKTTKLL